MHKIIPFRKVIAEFFKLADDYLNNGPNDKKYGIAASEYYCRSFFRLGLSENKKNCSFLFLEKLSTTPDKIQSTIESLVCLLVDSTRENAIETDLDSLAELGFGPDQTKVFWNHINNQRRLEPVLRKFDTKHLRFRDMEWRVEAKIASRAQNTQVRPAITIKLHLDTETINEYKDLLMTQQKADDKASKREVIFQTDLINLSHMINMLELAVLESKTERARNFVKAFV